MAIKLSKGVLTLGDPQPQPEQHSIVMDCYGKKGDFVGRRLRVFNTAEKLCRAFHLHKNPAKQPRTITGIF